MLRTIKLKWSAPEGCADPFGWLVRDLAEQAGIVDVAFFGRVLLKALAEMQTYAAGGGMARADGQTLPVTGDAVAANARIASLADQLDQIVEEQLEEAAWPLAGAEADDVRRALNVYRRRLSEIDWGTKATRVAKKPRKPATLLVLVLAHYWPSHTGTTPDAWRTSGKAQGKGHFYQFVSDVCERLGLDAPKVDTVRDVLRHCGHIGGRARP